MNEKLTILATCPSCMSHVRVERDAPEAECPFCATTFGPQASRQSRGTVARLAQRSTGIAAASALSLTLLGACGGEDIEDPSPDVEQQDVDQEDVGDAGDTWDTPDDNVAQDVYGAPLGEEIADVEEDVSEIDDGE
ncbi:hypothetical protein FRC96_05420 [Lujinxingia vulgaris]|uniref:Uncharacterized protein n=1 Tax=Lujinxingia vulgaris TaxID=2600176 RepID=A0A5C6XD34_9DELT|nr:hypothetical protein [Lujinxingia vulgaris]TXD40686.1 hypothetical protein FRC96_05420 [Lujinxingia vulgaris]